MSFLERSIRVLVLGFLVCPTLPAVAQTTIARHRPACGGGSAR